MLRRGRCACAYLQLALLTRRPVPAVLSPASAGAESLKNKLSYGVGVRKNEFKITQTSIAAIFWEGLSVSSVVTALVRVGFPETDLYAVGVLTGLAPDLSDFLAGLGIPAVDSVYCNNCFQDGAVLLIVRIHRACDEHRAVEVIMRHGGLLPPSCQRLSAAMQ